MAPPENEVTLREDEVGLATPVLAAGTVAAWFGLEIFYVMTDRPTISTQLVRFYRQWPTLGLLWGLVAGLLMGHWFWRD